MRKFSYSYKKEQQSIPKPCIIDNGLYKIKNVEDRSRLMENLVFIELIRRKRISGTTLTPAERSIF